MKKYFFAWIIYLMLGLLPLAHAQNAAVVRVAAASDLKFALEELAARYEKQTGQNITLVFGSSGQFTTQILQGAPFQIFMSADENFVYKLSDAGKTADRGKLYAIGRIRVFTPNGSPLKADGSLED